MLNNEYQKILFNFSKILILFLDGVLIHLKIMKIDFFLINIPAIPLLLKIIIQVITLKDFIKYYQELQHLINLKMTEFILILKENVDK